MRTEIVKIIEGFLNEDTDKVESFVEVLEKNYQKLDFNNQDRIFIKRILHLFYPEEAKYESQECCMD